MARPKSATHDIKRDAILDIAAQCFAQSSYPAASMNEIATACGTSKARLYHYYESKEAILFDLLDRHTQRLLAVIAQTEANAQRKDLNERAALHELVRAFLQEYETSATRHAALLNGVKCHVPTARVVNAFAGIAFFELRQIEPRAKMVAFAMHHGSAGFGRQVLKHIAQGFNEPIVQSVAFGRSAQTHHRHRALHLQGHTVTGCAFE